MLEIKNLHVTVDGKQILNGVDLVVNKGEVHAIMGPNGSGKSTLAYVMAGKDGYEATEGTIKLDGDNLLGIEPDERADKGLFLAFQYPLEIPGVATMTFLRTALNAQRKKRGLAELSTPDFLKQVRAAAKQLDIDALKVVSDGVNRLRSPDRAFVIITHYQRLLNYIVPDVVHVLSRGRIVKTGGRELALELEANGYAQYQDEAA